MIIEFESVSFRNFLTFGNKEQTLELKPGMNLVTGIDHTTGRSNGAGKSGILESITFGLYGRTNRQVNKDKIINWKNRKHCEVTVRFKIGPNLFRVRRGIKPDFLEIYKDNKIIPQPPDVRQYQKLLETDILKISFHMFISLVHINLNNYVPFLQMDTPKKRLFIEKMFGLEMFSDLSRLSNEKLVLMENQLSQYATEMSLKSKLKSDTIQKSISLHSQSKGIKSSKSDLDKIVEKLSKLEDPKDLIVTVSTSGANFDLQKVELDQSITKLSTTIELMSREKEGLEDTIEKKKGEIDRYKNTKETYKKIISENKGIDKLVDNERIRLTDIEKSLAILNTSLSESKVSAAEAQTSLDHYTSNLHTLTGKTECPICMTRIDKNIILPSIQGLIDKHKESINVFGSSIENIITKIIELHDSRSSSELSSLTETKKLYHEARTKLEGVNALIKSVDLFSDKKRLEDIKAGLRETDKEYKIVIENSDKLKKEIDKIHKMLELLQKRSEMYSQFTTQKAILEEKLTWEAKTRSDLQDQIDSLNKESKTLDKECKKLDESINKISALKDYVTYIKTLCKDENVKKYAISSILPYLTKRINEYLAQAGLNYFLNFTDILDEEIRGPGVYNASYGNLSGGEAKSIDLAILFSLLDISRIQFGVTPDILMLDELLDSSIDSRGIDTIMKIVWLRQMEDKSKIYIVTHRQDVESLANMRMYKVEKTGGFSTISEISD